MVAYVQVDWICKYLAYFISLTGAADTLLGALSQHDSFRSGFG